MIASGSRNRFSWVVGIVLLVHPLGSALGETSRSEVRHEPQTIPWAQRDHDLALLLGENLKTVTDQLDGLQETESPRLRHMGVAPQASESIGKVHTQNRRLLHERTTSSRKLSMTDRHRRALLRSAVRGKQVHRRSGSASIRERRGTGSRAHS